MNEDDIILTVGDFRRVFCLKGVRKAFQEAGLDYNHFLEHGATVGELKGHGKDALVDRALAAKRGGS